MELLTISYIARIVTYMPTIFLYTCIFFNKIFINMPSISIPKHNNVSITYFRASTRLSERHPLTPSVGLFAYFYDIEI